MHPSVYISTCEKCTVVCVFMRIRLTVYGLRYTLHQRESKPTPTYQGSRMQRMILPEGPCTPPFLVCKMLLNDTNVTNKMKKKM